MLSRRQILTILASPMFFPVSWAVGPIPAAHLFSLASTRDLAADEPLGVPLVDPGMPGTAGVYPVAQVPDALAKWSSLTPRLPARGATAHGDDGRIEWRVVDDAGGTQLVEMRIVSKRETRIVRYDATDDGVALRTSRMFTRLHSFAGLAIGAVFATSVYVVARGAKRRLPPATGVGRPSRGFASED